MVFSPVTLDDRDLLHPIIRQWGFENSDICFSNLLMWQKSIHTRYALTDEALFICFDGANQKLIMQPPVLRQKETNYAIALQQAIDYFASQNQIPYFLGVTASVRDQIEIAFPNQFDFNHTDSADDYVYATEKMISLAGKKLHNKRNHINKFLSFYPYRYEVYQADLHAEACLELNVRWTENKDETEGFMSEDARAMECALRNASALNMIGGVVFINDQIEAFTLGEQITDSMALIHIEKANADIPGLYPFINQTFVETAWPHTTWINREEDMGVENIRRAKESYYPERMIEKYSAKMNA